MEVAAKLEPVKNYKELTFFRRWKEQALAANSQKYLPAEEDLYLLLSFYDTYIYTYYYIKYTSIVRQHRTLKYPLRVDK